ncbi:MAG: YbjN domain-containing protein [Paracoccaceae bacterium]
MTFRSLLHVPFLIAPLTLSTPLAAQVPLGGIVTANDRARIAEILGAYGTVEQNTDDSGHWHRVEYDGTIYSVSFLNCDDADANCTTVQFRAWWRTEGGIPVDPLNAWNRDRRFSDAYLDDQNNVTVEYDVNLVGGVTAVNFDDTVQWWHAVLDQFLAEVINPNAPATK